MEKTILCFGDSNTHGTLPMASFDTSTRLGRAARWPGVMATALGDGYHVIEEGHGGRTTVHPDPYDGANRNGAAFLPALLETHRPVDLLIIMLGTNDQKALFSVGAQDIALSLGRLHRMARMSECGPDAAAPDVVFVVPPAVKEVGLFAQMFAGAAQKSKALPVEVATVAERVGARFFDANSVIETDPDEGVHFGAAAHEVLGRALADFVMRECEI